MQVMVGKMNKIKIRKARKEDLRQINEIYIEGCIDEGKLQFAHFSRRDAIKDLKKHESFRKKGWKKQLKSRKNLWLVTEIDGKIVGFANADIYHKRGRMNFLYIKKSYRRRGIGKEMTKMRINWLMNKKIKEIEAGAYVKNKPSINNLEKFGFIPTYIKLKKKLK